MDQPTAVLLDGIQTKIDFNNATFYPIEHDLFLGRRLDHFHDKRVVGLRLRISGQLVKISDHSAHGPLLSYVVLRPTIELRRCARRACWYRQNRDHQRLS